MFSSGSPLLHAGGWLKWKLHVLFSGLWILHGRAEIKIRPNSIFMAEQICSLQDSSTTAPATATTTTSAEGEIHFFPRTQPRCVQDTHTYRHSHILVFQFISALQNKKLCVRWLVVLAAAPTTSRSMARVRRWHSPTKVGCGGRGRTTTTARNGKVHH